MLSADRHPDPDWLDLPSALLEGLAPRTLPGLRRFGADLLHFNRSRNLLSRRAPAQQLHRLLLESLAAAAALPLRPGQLLLDLGSGAGIPGIPIALAHPGVACTLLDRRAVRCAFLRREIEVLGLGEAQVVEGEAKMWAEDPGLAHGFDWVCLKAVARPPDALELARPFLGPDGTAVLFRSEEERLHLDALTNGWQRPQVLPLAEARVGGACPCLYLYRRAP